MSEVKRVTVCKYCKSNWSTCNCKTYSPLRVESVNGPDDSTYYRKPDGDIFRLDGQRVISIQRNDAAYSTVVGFFPDVKHAPINEIRDCMNAYGPCTIEKLTYQVRTQCSTKDARASVLAVLQLPEFKVVDSIDGVTYWDTKASQM